MSFLLVTTHITVTPMTSLAPSPHLLLRDGFPQFDVKQEFTDECVWVPELHNGRALNGDPHAPPAVVAHGEHVVQRVGRYRHLTHRVQCPVRTNKIYWIAFCNKASFWKMWNLIHLVHKTIKSGQIMIFFGNKSKALHNTSRKHIQIIN